MPSRTIQEVLERQTPQWMAIPGIVGTAIGMFEGRPCIKLLVAEKTKELVAQLPVSAEGYRVVIEPTGHFRSL